MNKLIACIIFLVPVISCGQTFNFAKRVGGTQFENAMGIAVDSSSNIIVSGYFSGTADFDPSAATHNLTSSGGNDIFLARYDSAGNYLWAIAIGGAGEELTYADPAVDEYGNIYICGVFDTGADFNPNGQTYLLSNRGSQDGFIAKYDSTGTLIWARGMGGSSNDIIYRIDYKNYLILFTGAFADSAYLDNGLTQSGLYGNGHTDVALGKFTPIGNLLWVSQIGGYGNEYAYNITADVNGFTYVTGTFNDTLVINNSDTLYGVGTTAFVASYSSMGSYSWAFAIKGCIPFGISMDYNNNILTCGMFSGYTDFDPGIDTSALLSQGTYDAYFAKYTSSGNFIFAKRVGGSGMDVGYAFRELKDNTLLFTGYFSNTADFDPDVTIASLNSSGLADLFVAHYDSSGNYMNAFRCGSSGFDFTRNFIVDRENAIYIAGGFEQSVDFNPASGINFLNSAGSRDGYFAKYSFSPTGYLIPFLSEDNIQVYPNPFADYVTVHFSKQVSYQIKLTDITGQVLFRKKCNSDRLKIDTSQLTDGIYSLNIQIGNSTEINKKLVRIK